MIAATISITLPIQKFKIKGRDFAARTIIKKIIKIGATETFSAKIKRINATNKSNAPNILTNINLKRSPCF